MHTRRPLSILCALVVLSSALTAQVVSPAPPARGVMSLPIPQPMFPDPPAPVSHRAIVDGDWNQAATWNVGQVPGNGAIVSIPAARTVTVTSVETARIRFIEVKGELRFSEVVDTQLVVRTIYVASTGMFAIGSAGSPVLPGNKATVVFRNPNSAINLNWDPKQMSRGLVSDGTIRIFGATRTHKVAMTNDVLSGATTLDLGAPVPGDWERGDEVVLTGSKFEQNQPFEDEVLTIANISGNVIGVSPLTPIQFDHLRASSSMSHYVAHVTRNVCLRSHFTAIHRRGHIMLRNNDVEIHGAALIDLGRTDKTIPLDEIDVDINTGVVTSKPLSQIMNRRGRYSLHFHKNGIVADATEPPSKVYGCVVRGTPGWGFVNHSSHVDMQRNVCHDFAGAGFVTESGDELGNFFDNVAIRGTGVPGQYFFIRQVFENDDRPQPLGDFGFGGDGFWFQGPAIRARNNVANSCSGTGMFWFTTGAVDIGTGEYVGFPPADLLGQAAYGSYPSIGNLTPRTWTYSGNPLVLSDLPILEMDGFEGSACLVGFRMRFCNGNNTSFYGENPFNYNAFFTGPQIRVDQDVRNIKVWNNQQGFRVRYNEKTHWTDVENVNRLRYFPNVPHAGAEFHHQSNDQEFTNLTIDGYALAGWIHSNNNDNTNEVTFSGTKTYLNFVVEGKDLATGACLPPTGLALSNVGQTSVTLNWNPVANANRFLVRYRPVGSQGWQFATQPNGGAISITLTGLAPSTTYQLQIIVGCDDEPSNWSGTGTFTTN